MDFQFNSLSRETRFVLSNAISPRASEISKRSNARARFTLVFLTKNSSFFLKRTDTSKMSFPFYINNVV